MGLPFAADATSLPMHVLFPDDYRATRRRIVLDFLVLGAIIVAGTIALRLVYV
jgi:hypothetical protein